MFIQQAYKGDNTSWKVLLSTILLLSVFVANIVFVFFSDVDIVAEMNKQYELNPSKNYWLAQNLSYFIVFLLMLFGLVVYLHQRSVISLTTARAKIDFKRIAFSFGFVLILGIGAFAVECFMYPGLVVWDFQPQNFAILIILCLVLFPCQIGFEEYLFRGYFMQQIGIIARNRWVPLIITSVMFGLLHAGNPEVEEMGWITMIFYIGTGLFLGIITLMDDGLELALGFHFANNFLAATLVTAEYSTLRTDSLFKYTAQEASTSFYQILIPILIAYPIILIVLAKKYKWSNWKEKLLGRVPSQAETAVTADAYTGL